MSVCYPQPKCRPQKPHSTLSLFMFDFLIGEPSAVRSTCQSLPHTLCQTHHPVPLFLNKTLSILVLRIPGLCSTLGMAIVNLIDKKHLLSDTSEGFSFSGDEGVVWKARLWLFMGFALLAGGLAGSIVRQAQMLVSTPQSENVLNVIRPFFPFRGSPIPLPRY